MALTEAEIKRLESAISEAEKMTSGEIRLHIEDYCEKDPLQHARKAFERLGMHKTADRNGVLLYIALVDQKVAIYGDEGINSTVGLQYWSSIIEIITAEARNGDLVTGLEKALLELGTVLKKYYPYQHGDTNELDNTITYDGNGTS